MDGAKENPPYGAGSNLTGNFAGSPDTNDNAIPETRFRWMDEAVFALDRGTSEFIIHDVIAADGCTMLYGSESTFKTLVAVDMAGCVANGLSYHGRPTKKGLVMFFAGEGLSGLPDRFHAWAERQISGSGQQYKPADKKAMVQFYLRNIAISPMPEFCNQGDLTKLVDEIDAMEAVKGEKLSLIVIDTWARALNGADENSTKEAGELLRVVDQLASEFGCAVLVIHHSGNDAAKPRGATAVPYGMGGRIKAKRAKLSSIVTLEIEKQRDGEAGATIQLESQRQDFMRQRDGIETETVSKFVIVDSTVALPNDDRRAIALEKLRNGVPKDEVNKDANYSPAQLNKLVALVKKEKQQEADLDSS